MSSKIVQQHIPCPSCVSTDAFCTYDDGHGYCFSCQYFKPGKELDLSEFTYEYLSRRGISKETHRFYDVKTKVDADGKPVAVGYTYPNGAVQVKSLDKKEFSWKTGGPEPAKAGCFGRDKFNVGCHKYVAITEGADDALSLYQVLGGLPVVGVQSSGSAVRDCSVDYDFLNSFERVYLVLDGDAPGRSAAASIAPLFDYNKVFVVRLTKRKDATAYGEAGETDELKNIFWNSKLYLPETIVSSFAEFETILKSTTNAGVPYPYKVLTDMTYGIRTGETVLLTAQEKVGKTSIMHAIEYKLLKETDHAVAAIFLEEPRLRHLQALAGLELKKPVHLPDCGVSDAEVFSAVQKVVVRDERLHLYSHFGSSDPNALLDTFRFLVTARGCRYVLFDHITMAVSGGGSKDERGQLEYLATRLEMMVKELDFSLIMVSHLNDYGQTRGSHYLTKVADITIQAIRNPLALTELERNTTTLQIPFNRFCAKSGFAGALRLNPKTYILEEVFDVEAANDNFPLAHGKAA